jgi:prephenate dehydrogenase
MAAAKCLPESVDFIGCHPMAGKETSGIDYAEATLFRNAHFIMTPRASSTAEHMDLLERMAKHCGFRDVVRTTPEHHDAIIAYTSQLMHVVAVAVCDDPDLFSCMGYEGGSFRDCTRVAALDVPLWTQLFSMNAPALCKVIGQLEDRLRAYREVIAAGDRDKLSAMLSASAGRKRQMNLEARRGDDVK